MHRTFIVIAPTIIMIIIFIIIIYTSWSYISALVRVRKVFCYTLPFCRSSFFTSLKHIRRTANIYSIYMLHPDISCLHPSTCVIHTLRRHIPSIRVIIHTLRPHVLSLYSIHTLFVFIIVLKPVQSSAKSRALF